MAYEINFCETKEQLKHLGEVVTGKVDGSPTGADIEESTLSYTGQVRRTIPEVERLALESFRLGAAKPQGNYAIGVTFDESNWTYTYNGQQWGLSDNFDLSTLPYQATEADPNNDSNLAVRGNASEAYVQNYVGSVTNYQAASVDDIIAGKTIGWQSLDDTITHEVGQIWQVLGVWRVKNTPVSSVSDLEVIGDLYGFDFGMVGDGAFINDTAIRKLRDAALTLNAQSVVIGEGVFRLGYLDWDPKITIIGSKNYSPDYVQGFEPQGGCTLLFTSGGLEFIGDLSLFKLKNIRLQAVNGSNIYSMVKANGDINNGVEFDRVFVDGGQYNLELNGSGVGKGLLLSSCYLTGASDRNIITGGGDSKFVLDDNCLIDLADNGLLLNNSETLRVRIKNSYLEALQVGGISSLITHTGNLTFVNVLLMDVKYEIPNGLNTIFNSANATLLPSITIDRLDFTGIRPVHLYTLSSDSSANILYPKSNTTDEIRFADESQRTINIGRGANKRFTELTPRASTSRTLPNFGNIYEVSYETSPITIDTIDGGYSGQEIFISFDNTWLNVTFDFTSGNLKSSVSSTWSPASQYSAIKMLNVGTQSTNIWICQLIT